MPRGGKATKKPVAKRPVRKAKPTVEDDPLPDLESFLVELNNWPDVSDILAADYFKDAMEQFSNVADFRSELKECLAPCYGKKRIPRTPKKLVHKVPPRPIPQTTRVIDFEMEVNSDSTGNSAVIAVTGVVPQTPSSKIHAPSSNFRASKTQAGATQSPFNRLCAVNAVIASTPSNSMSRTANMSIPAAPTTNQSIRFGAVHPNNYSTPKPNASKSQMLEEINQKLEVAGKRHDNYVREQQERVARDNEQRKRRVNQNLLQKQQEEERKQQEIREHQERIRRFEQAQRSPKSTLRIATPAKIPTPAKIQTPGQKAVPQKRQKQVDEPNNGDYSMKVVKPTQLPVPKPRPAIIAQVPSPKSDVSVEEVFMSIEEHSESVVVEEQEEVIHREEISSAVELMEAEPEVTADKENQEQPPVHISPIVKQIKQDVSAYDMTPDKVFQPSTDNDYNVNDLSSGDETDNEDNPRKRVPRWAEKSALRTHVQALFRHISKDAVNSYFGVLKTPKLATLFASSDKTYDSMIQNETTAWDSPIANPRSAPLAAKQRNFKN